MKISHNEWQLWRKFKGLIRHRRFNRNVRFFYGQNRITFESLPSGTIAGNKGSGKKGRVTMMYPYLTLNDDTEITHSEMKPDGRVKVYVETPDDFGGFHHATCYLPDYTWENISGYSAVEMEYFQRLIRDNAHLILEFSQEGGILNAANF